MFRRQLPVNSPVTTGMVGSAWAGVVFGDRGARVAVESTLIERYGAKRLLLTDSGTSALRLAIELALSDRPGRLVALPAYCCYDVATAAIGARARVLLYDVDPKTLGPDFESFRRVLAMGVAAAVVAHLYGYPVDMDVARSLCVESGCSLIEDAAQAAGGELRGRLAGGFGPLSVLSFGRGKGTTGGGGGALLGIGGTESGLVERAVRLTVRPARGVRQAAALTAQWLLGRPALYGIPASLPLLRLGDTVYHEPHAASRVPPASLKPLLHALALDETERTIRRRNARRLEEMLSGLPSIASVSPTPGALPGFLRFPVLVAPALRAGLCRHLGERGMGSGYPLVLSDLPPLRGWLGDDSHYLPGATELASSLLTLPTHGLVAEEDFAAVRSVATAAPNL